MGVRLTKLRIAGFKSFAEPVSLDILPGLTGIVGPNGCGKSNVAEALRWAMGETSARSLRGGEMDDVIFAGSTARASRNLAEVTVTLEADGDLLPAPFEAEPDLQVTRRIERGAGSAFRANGRELRARDVQTLYADLASGARSSGMVSQGRVSDLVRARPEDRRGVLEEAAGIAGLHARRSEAELKLRAAEHNVARAGSLRAQLDDTREGLCSQARQTARYRAISGLIRAAEAEHLGVLGGQAAAAQQAARAEEGQASQALLQAQSAEQGACEALADAEMLLSLPRGEEAAARSGLERRRVEAETLGEAAARATREADEAAARLHHAAADLAHAGEGRADAAANVDRLRAAHGLQAARLAFLPDEAARAAAADQRAQQAVAAGQAASDEAASLAQSHAAAAQRASDDLRRAGQRSAALQAGHATLAGEHAAAVAARIDAQWVATAATALRGAEAALGEARAAFEQAETARNAAVARGLAQRAQADRAADARAAAEQRAREAAGRVRHQHAACQAAAEALAHCKASRVPGADRDAKLFAAEAASAALGKAAERLVSAEQEAAVAQEHAAAARMAIVDAEAAWERWQAALSAAQARMRRLNDERAGAEAALAEAEGSRTSPAALAALQAAHAAAEQASAARSAEWRLSEEASASASRLAAQARSVLAACEADSTQLRAERRGLHAAFEESGEEEGALSALVVPDGLQAAVGAALGELGRASLSADAGCFWRVLPALPPVALPCGSTALSELVGAPAALARVLSCVALLDDQCDGLAVQAGLAPGVVAVNRAGACWRWDGHVRQPGAPNWAVARLGLRADLARLQDRLAQADEATDAAGTAYTAAEAGETAAQAAAQAALSACRCAEAALRDAMQALERGTALSAQAETRLDVVRPAAQRLGEACRAAKAAEAAASQAAGLPDRTVRKHAHNAAAALALSAIEVLDQARLRLAEARLAEDQTRRAARDVAAAASDAEARVANAAPALAHAQAELAALQQAKHEAEAACLALPDLAQLQSAARAADMGEAAARVGEAAARARRDAAEAALDAARQEHARLHSAHLQAEWQVTALSERLHSSQAELDTACETAARSAAEAASQPDPVASEAAALAAHGRLEQARRAADQAKALSAGLRAELSHAERALDGVQAELDAWTRRLGEATARQAGLADRHGAAQAAWLARRADPAELAERAARSSTALAHAEAVHAAALAALADAEQGLRDRAAALREAALRVGAARDRCTRAQASCVAADNAMQAVLARVAERLDGTALPQAADHSAAAEERARRKFERLCRERDEMGPVNLRAELEMAALDGRIGVLEQEQAELQAAIAKLRDAIGVLNREGRDRLSAVFAQVDQHFGALFTRMMGGGRAHLALTGSDDPLSAGLEIYAEPPGKKLSALSLLSGGEQALTALSLIFAVFRCTPAPLCVLDEVDAPLDDANVERFCNLLDEMVRDTGTSFLVVTHHQLTMSRMDRLFGVTMQERGVSRLLSVDLGGAAAMVQPMLQAAE